MLIQKQDYKMDVDIEQTELYYESHSLCDCQSCRNYYAQVRDRFVVLDNFLSEFGVAIDRPDEIGWIEAENKVEYLFVSYTVCGRILEYGEYEMSLNDAELVLNIVIGGSDIPNEQKGEYFVITVYNIVLPWVLD